VNATDAERLLWSRLRRRQIAGFKFRRQHQVGLYICDFACLDRMLVVELDGSQHAENLEYDQRRDRFLRSAGFEVLRFWNNDVLGSIEGVLDTIHAALERDSGPSSESVGFTHRRARELPCIDHISPHSNGEVAASHADGGVRNGPKR
jgi:adenine-specific DNA-methyltransferase